MGILYVPCSRGPPHSGLQYHCPTTTTGPGTHGRTPALQQPSQVHHINTWPCAWLSVNLFIQRTNFSRSLRQYLTAIYIARLSFIMLAQASTLALLAAYVIASPTPQGSQDCTYSTRYTVESQEEVKRDPYSVSGIRCTSSTDNYCEIVREYSHSVLVQPRLTSIPRWSFSDRQSDLYRGVTQTVNGGITGGLDIGKIFSLGIEAGYSYRLAFLFTQSLCKSRRILC